MIPDLRKLITESAVYGLVAAAPALSGFVLVPVYTRRFPPAEYGVVGLLVAFLTLLSIIVVLSLDSAAQRWFHLNPTMPQRRATFASWFWCQMAAAAMLCLVAVALAGPLAGGVLGSERYAALLRVGAASLPLAAFSTVAMNWLRFERRAWAAATLALAGATASLASTLLYLDAVGLGLLSVPMGQVTGSGVSAALAVAVMRGWLDPRGFDLALLRAMLRYAVPLVPATVGIWVVNLFDRYIVDQFAGTAEVGFYQAANQVAAVVGISVTAFQLAWGPFAFGRAGQDDARESYAEVMLAFAAASSVVCSALGMFAPEVMRIVTTPRYEPGAQSVPWLAFSFVGVGLLSVAAIGPSIVGRTGLIATSTLVGAALTIVLDFALIPTWGSVGAAIATCVSWLAVPVYLFLRAEKMYPVSYPFASAVLIVGAGLSTAIAGQRLGSGVEPFGVKCLLLSMVVALAWGLLRRFARSRIPSRSDRRNGRALPDIAAGPKVGDYGTMEV